MKKDIIKVYLIQLLTLVVSLAFSILTSRILGAEGRGSFSLFVNSIGLATVLFGFSINSSIPYFINSLNVSPSKVFYTSLKIILLACGVLSIVLIGFDYFDLNKYSFPTGAVSYKIIFILIFFLQILYGVITSILNSKKSFFTVALLSFFNLFLPVLLYASIFFKLIFLKNIISNINLTLIVLLFSTLLIFCIAFIIVLKKGYISFSVEYLNSAQTKKFLTFSFLAYISNIASFICYKFDFWIIESYHGKAELGIYSLSSQLTQMLWILPQIMSSVLYTYASNKTREEAIVLTTKFTKIGIYLTLIIAAFGVLLSKSLIPILYGQEYSKVIVILSIQIIGAIPFCIPTITSSFYASIGNFKISFWISIIISMISVSLYYTFIPTIGSIGGAIASSITYFLGGIVSLIYFCNTFKVKIKSIILPEREDFSSITKLIQKKWKKE